MIGEQIGGDPAAPEQSGQGSAAQLRREALKAKALADAAFGENERRRMAEVALTLEREANLIEAALTRQRKAEKSR